MQADPTEVDGVSAEIAIIGMAGRFPGAPDIDSYWHNLRSGTESITRFSMEKLRAEGVPEDVLGQTGYVPAAPVLTDIDAFDAGAFGLTAREAALMDPQHRIFLECAWHALEDAGIDPGRTGGIGIFAGSNLSSYLVSNLLSGGPFLIGPDSFELLIHNDKDYLSTRVAHAFGLTGPVVGVQTACSTSLVAVHQGIQALLSGECDIALAGGVSVRVPHQAGYLPAEGMVLSPDGRCRPFDAAANGTVFGSGCGAVVLRRLPDAVRGGNRAYAVIKASAVVNDGANKVGFTAPGLDGQVRVVATALELAGVGADTIDAVEAHGTGTRLGDPLEVAALTRAYRATTNGTEYCALSSVKSNIGHLESAAGIAGLIKATLQLEHQELVPSLHFSQPNPEIDFSGTPFRVPTVTEAWPRGSRPRRIGVSAFGMGGTNAHAVLEEAPPAPRREALGPDRHLLVLSAASRQALRGATAALGEHLVAQLDSAQLDSAQPDGVVLADAAHTLRHGRRELAHRCAVVLSGPVDTSRWDERPLAYGRADGPRPKLVYLLPGQGSQYLGMGEQLYHEEPVFRAHVDQCARLLRPLLGTDLRQVLYPTARDRPAAARLTSTDMAQPALFVCSTGIAEVLRSWGVRPDALIGHSVGEISAAYLAGILELPEALGMVALRGRLMAAQPPGTMISVAADPDDVAVLGLEGVELAVLNGPQMPVYAGPSASVAALEAALTERAIPFRRLHTSHAFHSAQMDPVAAELAAQLAGVGLRTPSVPLISNLSGTWMTDVEATDPHYWGRHTRAPVRFGDGLVAAAQPGPSVLLEVGPGRVLSALARPLAGDQATAVIPTAPPSEAGPAGEAESLLLAAGHLWACGLPVRWDDSGLLTQVPAGPRTAALPGYPFRRTRYWVRPQAAAAGTSRLADRMVQDSVELDERTGWPDFVAPDGEPESSVAQLWEEVLGVTPIGVLDNFFELGGNSLLAARMVTLLADRLDLSIELSRLVAEPTVRGVVTAASHETGDRFARLVPDPEHRFEPFPLLEMQQAQWLGRAANFELGGVAAQVYLETEGEGLDPQRLEQAWNRVVARHEALRIVVLPDGRQRILPDPPAYRFTVLDVRRQDREHVEQTLRAVRSTMSDAVRPADTYPLWEIRLTLLDGGRVRTHLGFDLLVADVSGLLFQLLADWRRCYARPELVTEVPALSFRDYVLAERRLPDSPRYQRSLAYWRDRAVSLPASPRLPLTMPLASVDRPRFSRWHAKIDRDVSDRIRQQCAARGLTVTSALLAGYATVLASASQDTHFLLNLTAVNRLPLHEDVGELVGEFASFDLLEVEVAEPGSIGALAQCIQRQIWADLEHNVVSGLRALREVARQRRSTTGALAPVVFTSALAQQEQAGQLQPTAWLGRETHLISQTPQVLLDHFVMSRDGALDLSWHAIAELFPPGALDAMFEAYLGLVHGLADPAGWATPCHGGLTEVARYAVPAPITAHTAAAGIADPTTTAPERSSPSDPAVVALLVQVAAEVLGAPEFGPELDFFEQGGDSIMAVQLATRVTARGYELDPRDVFDHPSMGELAGCLRSGSATEVRLSSAQRLAVRAGAVSAVVVRAPDGFEPQELADRLDKVSAEQPNLRLRCGRDAETATWWDPAELAEHRVVDLQLTGFAPAELPTQLRRVLSQLAAELDLTVGVGLRAAVLTVAGEKLVALLAHRACLPASRWPRLLDALDLPPIPPSHPVAEEAPVLPAEVTGLLRTAVLDAYRLSLGEALVAAVLRSTDTTAPSIRVLAERDGETVELVELTGLAGPVEPWDQWLPTLKEQLRSGPVITEEVDDALVVRLLAEDPLPVLELVAGPALQPSAGPRGLTVGLSPGAEAHTGSLLAALPEVLRRLLAHCEGRTETRYGPADFPEAGLDADQLLAFLGDIG